MGSFALPPGEIRRDHRRAVPVAVVRHFTNELSWAHAALFTAHHRPCGLHKRYIPRFTLLSINAHTPLEVKILRYMDRGPAIWSL